jgi:2-keto-3-deoxy-L-rhamnonate aldolase RhmA
MRSNPIRDKVARNDLVFGIDIMDLTGPGLPQIMKNAGADFILYDMEAGCLDLGLVKTQLALTRGLGIPPLVATPWHDYHFIVQALDAGAMGVIVPVVETREQAEHISRVSHYRPQGARGVALGIMHDDYLGQDLAGSLKAANDRTLVAAKVETAKGIENVEAIAAVPGIDIVFTGHMDLSVSLDVPGDYDNPKFVTAIEKLVAAARKHGKTAGCLVPNPEWGKLWISRGFRFVVFGTEVMHLTNAYRAGIGEMRKAL